jgi:tetraacyldisaccharide 4'-kinase
VGGTGKTPIAAWFAQRLREAGATPAIVLRGYGDDEPKVHTLLNPGVDVVADPERARGVETAAARGADVAVLDDAFQHRRLVRDADVVLVSAERGLRPARLLPAGPYREPPAALRRAAVVIVTRKSASPERAAVVANEVVDVARNVPVAIVALVPAALRPAAGADGVDVPVSALENERVLAIAAIGEPESFVRQLSMAGARVDAALFPDHHPFARHEVESLARRAESVDRVVCTLKDAVKLGLLWPPFGPPLWYVSQRVDVERGAEVLDALIARLLAARSHHTETTGLGRPR